jgi:bacterioferritin-associated ferredoxin
MPMVHVRVAVAARTTMGGLRSVYGVANDGSQCMLHA